MRIIFDKFPLPPSENHAYPTNKSGRRFKGKAFKQFEKDVEDWRKTHLSVCRRAKTFVESACPDAEDHIVVDCYLGFHRGSIIWPVKQSRRKNDAHNRIKALFDGLSVLVGKDDSSMFPGRVEPVLVPESQPECSLIVMTKTKLRTMEAARRLVQLDSSSRPDSLDKGSKSEMCSLSSTKSEEIEFESLSMLRRVYGSIGSISTPGKSKSNTISAQSAGVGLGGKDFSFVILDDPLNDEITFHEIQNKGDQ